MRYTGRPLTVEWLRAAVQAREVEGGGVMDCTLREVVAAIATLRALIGEEWVQEKILEADEGSFINPTRERDLDNYKLQSRIVSLAEILFNLQLVEGIHHRIRALKTADIETALAELEGAHALYTSNIPFRFVVPSMVAGSDYDVEALVGAITVPCEMKAKLETTKPTAASVAQTIDRARKQLPPNRPSTVFLWVPESWAANEQGRAAIEEGIARGFHRSARIARIFVHWEEWQRLQPSGALRIVRWLARSNPRARVPLSALDNMMAVAEGTSGWVQFNEAVCEEESLVQSRSLAVGLEADEWARGLRPPPDSVEFGVLYRGDLAALRALDKASVVTVIEFNCEEFELFEVGDIEDPCINVSVDDDEGEFQFTVCRGGRFQFEIPGLMHDEDLRTEGAVAKPPIARMKIIQEAIQAGRSFEEVDDGDLFIRSLRGLFARLRSEGGLVRPTHMLTSVTVRYLSQQHPTVPIFSVEYYNRPVLT